jgi:hypothetical protein
MDDFNLFNLKDQFKFYNHALHLILDMEICNDDDEDLDMEDDEEGSNNNEWG